MSLGLAPVLWSVILTSSLASLGWMLRELWRIRANDLAHMQADIAEIKMMLVKHLEWHAGH